MSTLALREAERQALTATQRILLACCTSLIVPGDPAAYEDTEGTAWAIFDDARVPLIDVALGGAVMAVIDTLTYDPEGRTREEIRADLLALTAAARVEPEDVPAEAADRIAEVWAAQAPPVWAQMWREVPPGWGARTV